VPTPFYHLSVADELLEHPRLPPAARSLLSAQRGAFLFGNTAPDVQVISQQRRQDTHFFDLPLRRGAPPPWEEMLVTHPSLGDLQALPASQAAFLTGYLCHLQADWMWVKEIFVPVFGLRSRWLTFPRRLVLHNVLRAYLDRQILPSLSNGACASLSEAQPSGWLPFVGDASLSQWRDFLVGQLRPGASIQTIEVFATRQGVSPDEFYRLIDSEDGMEGEIFTRVSRESLHDYRSRLVDENLQLIHSYLHWRSNSTQ
jgi:hypothetical protein